MRVMWHRHLRAAPPDDLGDVFDPDHGTTSRITLLLFDADPGADDQPVAVAPMPDADPVSAIAQGSLVSIRGWPQPGGAIAVELPGDHVVHAVGPCGFSNARRDRWAALVAAAPEPGEAPAVERDWDLALEHPVAWAELAWPVKAMLIVQVPLGPLAVATGEPVLVGALIVNTVLGALAFFGHRFANRRSRPRRAEDPGKPAQMEGQSNTRSLR